jgi:hypothetical protein
MFEALRRQATTFTWRLDSGLEVIDISNPSNPLRVESITFMLLGFNLR